MQLFDFALTAQEVQQIHQLNTRMIRKFFWLDEKKLDQVLVNEKEER